MSKIHVISGPSIIFPLSQAFLIESNGEYLLADPGCGQKALFTWLEQHEVDLARIDILLISHPHPDHVAISKELVEKNSHLHVMAHKDAIPFIEDWYEFKEGYADFTPQEWLIWEKHVRELTGFQNFNPVDEALREGQSLVVGELTLNIIYTPGHTPGHISLHCPELSTLLSFDIDLTSFPWYGNKNSDLNDFVESTQKLQQLDVSRVLTSHCRPLSGQEIPERFENYLNKIELREQRIKALVMDGLSFQEIVDRAPIYGQIPFSIFRKFDQEMVKLHLERLGFHDELVST